MTDRMVFDALSDDELLRTVRQLTARANVALANLLAHLGEVERRGIHRTRGCASLYTYLVYELRLSEDVAFRRAKAARLVREYPEVQGMIAKGELHLTALLMIGPYLGGERHQEILERARFRTKREIARLIRVIDPAPEVPPLVEPLGPASPGPATHRAFVHALAGPVRALPPGERPEDWIEAGNTLNGGSAVACDETLCDEAVCEEALCDEATFLEPQAVRWEPERPLHYKVQFTASQDYVDLLKEAVDLLSHQMPKAHLADVQLRAMRELVKQLRRQKRAAAGRPRASDAATEHAENCPPSAAPEQGTSSAAGAAPERGTSSAAGPAPVQETSAAPERDPATASETAPARQTPAAGETAPERTRALGARTRHIPASVQRAVWARDGERCAYVDDRGIRCRETRFLELHHRHACALGGPSTVANLEVRCRVHNALAAEHDFGRSYMNRVRGMGDGTTSGAI